MFRSAKSPIVSSLPFFPIDSLSFREDSDHNRPPFCAGVEVLLELFDTRWVVFLGSESMIKMLLDSRLGELAITFKTKHFTRLN